MADQIRLKRVKKSIKILPLKGSVRCFVLLFSCQVLNRHHRHTENCCLAGLRSRSAFGLLVEPFLVVLHYPSQSGSPAPETDVAVEEGQVEQRQHEQTREDSQGQADPPLCSWAGQHYPQALPQGQHQEHDQGKDEPIEDRVVLFAHAVVDELAVVIKLLDAPIASFAVIAVGVDHRVASFAPLEGVLILFEGRTSEPRVYWVGEQQLQVVVDDEQQ